MNISILLIELLILTVAFSAEVIISITKNPEAWVADYPPEIQEEYYKTHENKRCGTEGHCNRSGFPAQNTWIRNIIRSGFM